MKYDKPFNDKEHMLAVFPQLQNNGLDLDTIWWNHNASLFSGGYFDDPLESIEVK